MFYSDGDDGYGDDDDDECTGVNDHTSATIVAFAHAKVKMNGCIM